MNAVRLGLLMVMVLLAGCFGKEDAGGAECGNGTVEGAEECDDGNTEPGDGCDAECAWEPCSDGDGDGHDDASCGGDDCDDADAANFPGNAEACDGRDNDCDGDADDGLTFADYYPDVDEDGYGDATATPVSACAPVAGLVADGTDCDDADAAANPGATEVPCDTVDNDCDPGTRDEVDLDMDSIGSCTDCSDTDPDNWTSCSTCLDEDTDGAFVGCDAYVMRAGPDCAPLDDTVYPGATESCDGIDNDCDGATDNDVVYADYYPDVDNDGYGDGTAAPVNACSPQPDAVTDATDCDDSDPNNWASCGTCVDGDVDGTYVGCDAYQTILEDCDDVDPLNFPNNPEVCDGIDNDCSGTADDGLTYLDYWPDNDLDGYGDGSSLPVNDCAQPAQTAPNSTDCNDDDASINPGAIEICEDTIDNDCVGGDAPCACGNGSVEAGETCDDGNLCAYDGCSSNPVGSPNQCQGEETVILTALALGNGTTGFDLDGDGTTDNRLGSSGALRTEFNNMLTATLNSGALMQVFTIADLDNVPYSGSGTPGYRDDADIVVSMYPTLDPACPTNPVYDATNQPPWISGPWPVDVYSDSDAWNLAACTGAALITDADDPANGIYPTAGGQLSNPPPAAPYLSVHTTQLSLNLAGAQTTLHDARMEAQVIDDTVGISELAGGILGGAVAARDLWAISLDGPGGNCETALHAILAVIGGPDIDIDAGGIETLSATCTSGGFGCFIPCGASSWAIDDCVDEDGTTVPDSDVNNDGVIQDGECVLDARIADGYSAGMTFAAREVTVVTQESGTTYCP